MTSILVVDADECVHKGRSGRCATAAGSRCKGAQDGPSMSVRLVGGAVSGPCAPWQVLWNLQEGSWWVIGYS